MGGMPRKSIERARAAKQPARRGFSKIARVVGVGLTRVGEDYAVKINLDAAPGPGAVVPTRIDGVLVCVEVTGTPRAGQV